MYAIVLTHDVQLGLAELVHKRYCALWPGHPLTFRIPVNGSGEGSALSYLRGQADCDLVPSPRPIGATMKALVDGIPDDIWVYWCIDDRFPTWLDADAVDNVCAGLDAAPPDVEEVKLLRWRERLSGEITQVGPVAFAVQAQGPRAWGFWHHHFIRAGTLRRVFVDTGLPGDVAIGDVLSRFGDPRRQRTRQGRAARDCFRGSALVPTRPLVELGEPLVRGLLTRNGLDELRRWDCEVPPYAAIDRETVYTWADG
ncbi:MAG: hypothetical protein QOI99_1044 [Actinomycetota bacterium]|nr:hypothetical protein [Actinomycetota bacterium]